MAIYYKLTDKDAKTRNGVEWVVGRVYQAKGKGKVKCCSNSALHAYKSPELAVFLTPLHNEFLHDARLFEVEGRALHVLWDKVGCRTLRCLREVKAAFPTANQRVAFGILCAKEVINNEVWLEWANQWLVEAESRPDKKPARVAGAVAADDVAAEAARTATDAVADIAHVADIAAVAEWHAAASVAARTAIAARTATDAIAAYGPIFGGAVYSAAARTAAEAVAAAAAATNSGIDFVAIAKRAMEY